MVRTFGVGTPTGGTADVAAPRIVRSVDGAIVALVAGARWRVFGWIDVAGPSSLRQAGATLARLHAAGWPTTDEVDARYRDRTVGGPWGELLDRARDQPWAPMLREQIPDIEALEAIARAAAVPPCRMCHRDFNEAVVPARFTVLDRRRAGGTH